MKKLIGLLLLLALSCTDNTTKVIDQKEPKHERPPRCVVPPHEKNPKKTVPRESDRTLPVDKPLRAPRSLYGVATNFNILVLLVDFPDKPFRTAPAYFDRLMFGADSSFKDYYLEVSNGAFNSISAHLPSATGVLRLPQTYSTYTGGNFGFGGFPNNAQRMAQDAILAADGFVDFSSYDNDGDGVVDGVILIHAGSGAELTGSSSDIWSHMWSFPVLTVDGKTITDYCTAPEYWVNPGDMKIGVIAHEAGHLYLNQIDEYGVCGGWQGVGRWCLMGGGSYNGISGLGDSPAYFCARSRQGAGFGTPQIISDSGQYSVTGGQFYRIGSDSEIFLIENRQRTGYDSYLPGDGLLIWHLKSAFGNCHFWRPGLNADSSGWGFIQLVQADGLFGLENNVSSGNAGDPYPGSTGNTVFTATSTPNSNWYGGYDGVPSGVNITNVSSSGAVMSFTLGAPPPPPPDTVRCPADLTVTCGKKQNGKTVSYAGNCTPPSGSFFPVGVTTVDCGDCTFTVTVRQTGKQ